MTISEIYKKYKIPSLLQDHMYRVAAVGRLVTESINPEVELDIDIVTKELLLHDMGNIIKFSFDKNSLYSKEESIELRKIQTEFIEKYGNEEHVATEMIAKEIGVPEKVINILENTGSSKLHLTVDSKDWYFKVCSYADFRISPFGLVTVEQRFDEVIKRYEGRTHVLGDIEKTQKKKELAVLLQSQIQTKSNRNLTAINEEEIQKIITDLKKYEL